MLQVLRRSFADRIAFSPRFWLCCASLVVPLTFGGGSRQWLPSEFVCQLFGLVFLAAAFAQLAYTDGCRVLFPEVGLAIVILALPTAQLIPLPPFVWTWFPGRAGLIEAFRAAQVSLPWQPISLVPDATYQALFSLCAPAAVFVVSLLLTLEERRAMSLLILAFGGLSVVLAMLQVVQGPDSPLRFYAITNVTLPVGFFANRNHFAASLYCTLPLAAAWVVSLGLKVRRSRRTRELDHKRLIAYLAATALFVGLLLMQGLVHSRAGLLITIVAAVCSLSLAIPYRKSEVGTKAVKGMVIALVIAVILMGYYALYSIVQQFDRDPVDDARFTILSGAWKALWAYFPVGSGFGTFDAVYRAFELPSAATSEYINRAHDDILETLIEGGVFTFALMMLFAVWLARRLWRVWAAPPEGSTVIDVTLARAAAFVPLLLTAQCFFDYPLRTAAVMSLLAFCCALTVPPVNRTPEKEAAHRSRRTRRMRPVAVADVSRSSL